MLHAWSLQAAGSNAPQRCPRVPLEEPSPVAHRPPRHSSWHQRAGGHCTQALVGQRRCLLSGTAWSSQGALKMLRLAKGRNSMRQQVLSKNKHFGKARVLFSGDLWIKSFHFLFWNVIWRSLVVTFHFLFRIKIVKTIKADIRRYDLFPGFPFC